MLMCFRWELRGQREKAWSPQKAPLPCLPSLQEEKAKVGEACVLGEPQACAQAGLQATVAQMRRSCCILQTAPPPHRRLLGPSPFWEIPLRPNPVGCKSSQFLVPSVTPGRTHFFL